MTTEELKELLERLEGASEPASATDVELLKEAVRQYPYFLAPRILLLRAGVDADDTAFRLTVAMGTTSDRIMATAATGTDANNFYPPMPDAETPATEDVIDHFLNTYGNVTPQEEALLEKMIFNPTPDYGEILAREEQEDLPEPPDGLDPDSQDARVNAFILSQHPAARPEPPLVTESEKAQPKMPVEKPTAPNDAPLSESLSQIFIKRGRYERAYEIISGLSLKFPKKSAYFADQLRFLQILIKNQRLSGQGPESGRNE